MNKKLLLIALSLAIPFSIFASPFGLRMGMTLEQITEVCGGIVPNHNENDSYFIKPTNNHPLFKYYLVYVDEEIGLYYIKALTDEISSNDYGEEIKSAFENIKDRISKNYGNPKVIDEVASDTIWSDEEYWFYALQHGARTLTAIWGIENPIAKDDIEYIGISAKYSSYRKGIILLEYRFKNYSQIEDLQDSVF